jgi:DNA-binding XRE family transcriptional regulator
MEVNNVTIRAMAEAIDVSTGTVNNLRDGLDPRVSLAIKIERATFGKVTYLDLAAATLEKDLKNHAQSSHDADEQQ